MWVRGHFVWFGKEALGAYVASHFSYPPFLGIFGAHPDLSMRTDSFNEWAFVAIMKIAHDIVTVNIEKLQSE
jgi:hypothetical protein